MITLKTKYTINLFYKKLINPNYYQCYIIPTIDVIFQHDIIYRYLKIEFKIFIWLFKLDISWNRTININKKIY